ncbi:MAG: hypothetical protein M3429_04760 [Verrucomicrobiota bacterium]|nr:hypothetical protein [Verrucomicrobiota bacterium]
MNDAAAAYYRSDAAVRARLREFLGCNSLGKPTCCYLRKGDQGKFHRIEQNSSRQSARARRLGSPVA